MGVEFAAGAPRVRSDYQLPESQLAKAITSQRGRRASSADKFAPQPEMQTSAAEFRRYRMQALSVESSASLELSLKTLEGDTVTLSLSQTDAMHRLRFAGQLADKTGVRLDQFDAATDSALSVSVVGNLSAAETAAIDRLLSQVEQVAAQFFQGSLVSGSEAGSMDAALAVLQDLDFDVATLAELSLDMSMSRSVEFTQAYANSHKRGPHQGGAEALQRLADRDTGIGQALARLADAQRGLIGQAGEMLDAPSAVRVVQALLPPVLQERLHERQLGRTDHGAGLGV